MTRLLKKSVGRERQIDHVYYDAATFLTGAASMRGRDEQTGHMFEYNHVTRTAPACAAGSECGVYGVQRTRGSTNGDTTTRNPTLSRRSIADNGIRSPV